MRLDGRHIHFVGAGGIGMSALAHMAVESNAVVSGCDLQESPITRSLAARGCRIHQGHHPEHLEGVELVVRSSAVPEREPELQAALRRHIPVISRARMLARLAGDHQVVAVAGAHGKTTTTWLVAKLLLEARLDPSVMVGGMVPELGGNYRLGSGGLFVVEVDESDGSLLEFAPHYSIVTNVELDHVDRYPDLEAVQRTFRTYLRRTARDGCVILGADSGPARDTLDAWEGHYLTYGLAEDADLRAENVRHNGRSSVFDVRRPGGRLDALKLSLPGEHNVRNALAAVALASALGIDDAVLRAALGHASGVGRRLEAKGRAGGVVVLDDYGHHPTEIRAALAAARGLAEGRLVGVFQPHRFTRTLHLGEQFGPCFDELDHLVLLPIYAAGEAPIEGVTSARIQKAVEQRGSVSCARLADMETARRHVLEVLRPGDTLLTLGAGDVYRLGERILADLKERSD
ncbi:MAG: UDP-N-acetylmuramate--L-alanine ligase [Candidatus Brocadiia bacterium]